MSDPTNPTHPPILTYDTAPKAKSPSRRVVFGYWCGLAISAVLYALAIFIATLNGFRDAAFSPTIDALMFSSMWLLFEILLGTLFLGLALWIKTKIVKEVAFAPFRSAIPWGFAAGILSPLLLFTLDNNPTLAIALALGILAWYCLVPIIAGQFLCYRTHLRD